MLKMMIISLYLIRLTINLKLRL